LPDLEHVKAAVLNSLNSADAKRVIVTPSKNLLTGIDPCSTPPRLLPSVG